MSEKQGQLVRSIGLGAATALVISSVIGSGVFKKVAPMSAELQSPTLVLLCWVLAGLVSLAGTLSNAEIGSMLADSGGEFAYFRTIYNRFFAYLFGWSQFAVVRTASIASLAYVFSQSFNSLVPLGNPLAAWADVDLLGLHPFDNSGVKILGITLIVGLTYFNYRGLKLGASLSNVLTVAMLIIIALIVVLGLTMSDGSMSNITTNSVTYDPDKLSGMTLFKAMFVASLSAFWGYEGWAALGYIGGEIKNPQRNLPLALTLGSLIIMAVYLLLNFTYLYVMPIDNFIAIHQSQNGIAAVSVVKHFLGEGGGWIISVLILITTFNCTSSTLLTSARISYSMAKDGVFFKGTEYVHPDYNTPSKALWIQAFWSAVMMLSGTFDQLTDMLIFASFIFYGATTVGVFILRKRMPDAERPYKVVGYPIVPLIFIVACVALLINTLFSRPYEALIGLALIATGLPFYWYWTKK
ncbi:MAG: amino acid permease [Spirosomataceae bacterium]